MVKIKSKGMIIVAIALLMMAVLVPVYALGDQSGIMRCPRDQANEDPPGPTTRSYGEDSQNPEGLTGGETFEDVETPIQEQNQTREQLRDSDGENEDCEQFQYQYQYQNQYQYQHGQEED
jgi:hypothetical protein